MPLRIVSKAFARSPVSSGRFTTIGVSISPCVIRSTAAFSLSIGMATDRLTKKAIPKPVSRQNKVK